MKKIYGVFMEREGGWISACPLFTSTKSLCNAYVLDARKKGQTRELHIIALDSQEYEEICRKHLEMED